MAKKSFPGIIKSVHIEKFRKFNDVSFDLGSKLTAIVGQNGTMKTTLLGLIAQPFSMYYNKNNTGITDVQKKFFDSLTLDGYKFQSKFADKFNLDSKREKQGEHFYTLYFYDTNFVTDGKYSITSIPRSKKARTIRLWNANGRAKDDGFIHYPVIYLSLKRVTPIGEEIRMHTSQRTDSYLHTFNEFSKEILISPEEYTETDYIKSSNKSTLISHPAIYGAETVSAGQDNIGKILTAILSFKNLQKENSSMYNGGLLFIDELDVTLYPAAQKKLVEKLFRFASDYNIQIIFTTHSPTIINLLYEPKYAYDKKIIFLKEIAGKVICEENLTAAQINAKLNVEVLAEKDTPQKIRVYTEDNEARKFLKALLPHKYLKLIDIINVNLGAEELKTLAGTRKVPEFMNNLIILDGDKESNHKNIITLPTPVDCKCGPDRLLYDFLKSLSDDDEFWPGTKHTGYYDKQSCFSGYPSIDPNHNQARDSYKEWFKSQERYWGSRKDKAFKYWISKNEKIASEFIKRFVKAYNFVAVKNHFSPIK